MSKCIYLRQAKHSDSEVLSVLCITVWIDTYSVYGLDSAHANYVLTEYTPENLAQRINDSVVYVAETEENIGLVVLCEESGEIETLYVLPRFKGLGVGSSLVETLRKKYNRRLYLTCWEGNSAALEFYKKIGFTNCGESFFDLDRKKIRNVELSSS